MARLLMGSIVTKAVGKIGGHCFRIKGTTQILGRNPNPFKNRAVNQNSAMNVIRTVFSDWKYLDTPQQNAWREIAIANPVPDRFGNPKTLSGREFFSRVNINSLLVGGPDVEAAAFVNTVPFLAFNDVTIDTKSSELSLVELRHADAGRLAFYIMQIPSLSYNPTPRSIKLIASMNVADYTNSVAYTAVLASGFSFNGGNNYAVACRLISDYGIASPYVMYSTAAIG